MTFGVIEPLRRGRATLPDGRALGWSEWGPEDGAPVLYFPGAGMSGALGFGAHVVERLGVRLIALDRPGLGRSDPQPRRSLTDWADDVGAFGKRRGLTKVRVVAFSQGAPFALAYAAAGAVAGVAIASGGDELAAPELREQLAPEVRSLVERAITAPEETEAWFRSMRAETLRSLVLAGAAEADRAFYLEPGFDPAFRRALEEGFAQGAGGYARDTLLAMSRWPFDLGGIEVPVDLWYGAGDASPVHSPDLGGSLARRIPTARRMVIEGAGGAVLWTHAEAILEQLLARSS